MEDAIRINIRKFFQRVDPKGLGTVNEEKFLIFIRQSGLQDELNANEITKLIERLKRSNNSSMIDYERFCSLIKLQKETVSLKKCEEVLNRFSEAANKSASAGRPFLSLCSLVDPKGIGFLSIDELMLTAKMMDCTLTKSDIEALQELLPAGAKKPISGAIEYQKLNTLLQNAQSYNIHQLVSSAISNNGFDATASNTMMMMPPPSQQQINMNNTNGYGTLAQSQQFGLTNNNRIGMTNTYDPRSPINTYGMPFQTPGAMAGSTLMTPNGNYVTHPNMSMNGSIQHQQQLQQQQGLFNPNTLNSPMRTMTGSNSTSMLLPGILPPTLSHTMSQRNLGNSAWKNRGLGLNNSYSVPDGQYNNNPSSNNNHLNIYEQIIAQIADKIQIAIKQRSADWGSPFSLKRQFEIYDLQLSGAIALPRFQDVLNNLSILCNASDLTAVTAMYGRPDNIEYIDYDAFCRDTVDNYGYNGLGLYGPNRSISNNTNNYPSSNNNNNNNNTRNNMNNNTMNNNDSNNNNNNTNNTTLIGSITQNPRIINRLLTLKENGIDILGSFMAYDPGNMGSVSFIIIIIVVIVAVLYNRGL